MKIKFIYNHLLHKQPYNERKVAEAKLLLEEEWQKKSRQILQSLSWIGYYELDVNVYLLDGKNSHSLPLVLGTDVPKEILFHVFIHELIHRLIGEREEEMSKKYYPQEEQLAGVHVFTHAVHESIYHLLGDEAIMEKDIAYAQDSPPYARAWEIVKEEGYKNIIAKIEKTLHELP